MATPAAIFDLDGTLCTGHIWQGLLRYCKEHGLNRRRYYGFMTTHLAMLVASKARLLGQRRLVRAWGGDMAVLLEGLEVVEGERVLQAVFQEVVLPTLRPDVVEQVRWHRIRRAIS